MIGTDIIEVARIEKLIKEKGDKFLNRIYTQIEIDYCESKGANKYQHYAGRFAAKEAIFKAINSCANKRENLKFKDIRINNQKDGDPFAEFYNGKTWSWHLPLSMTNYNPKYRILAELSISHVKEYAIAVSKVVIK